MSSRCIINYKCRNIFPCKRVGSEIYFKKITGSQIYRNPTF